MPVINGVYTKDFPALGRAPIDTDIIPIAEVANQITYKTTIGAIFNAKVFGTTGRLSKFTTANTLGNSILNEIGNAINLTNAGSSFASFGIINPGTPGDPGVDNDSYIGSTINNDFIIRVNNTEAARFDTALRLKIANIQNATIDTDKFLVSDGGIVKYRTGTELRSDIGAGTVTSVGLTMPVAFSVANSPITSSGSLDVTAIGTASQYIRGDGQLATLPTGGGGGSAVNYYLNGSVAASVATYKQMSNSAVIGGGTDFTLTGNGLIAQFLTDVNNPNRLLIPSGAWNLELFFSSNSAGGNEKFYTELLKYNGTTFTSIASGITTPEAITGGTATDLYLTSIAVPETILLATDRLAIRVYIVDNAVGRTVTLHTEDNTLCQIITTFAGGISALNGLTANTQYFAVGTLGTDFAISSLTDTHTFNLPTASATNRGALSSANWTTFNNKQDTITLTTTGTSGAATLTGATLNIPNYGSALTGYVPYIGATGAVDLGAFDLTVNGLNIGQGAGNIITNTCVGYIALSYNTIGQYNTTLGFVSLRNNTTGSYNTAIGSGVLDDNTTGSYNTAIGSGVLSFNTIGIGNTALGTNALFYNTLGSGNIAIGNSAGSFIFNGTTQNTTSGDSIYLGNNTRPLANGNTNEIVIGQYATGGGSNSATLGNSSISTTILHGNTSIGYTTNPSLYKLDVNGTLRVAGAATFSSSVTAQKLISASSAFAGTLDFGTGANKGIMDYTAGSGLWYLNNQTAAASTTTPYFQFQADSSPILTMLKNGNVGIGTTTPGKRLHLQADSDAASIRFTNTLAAKTWDLSPSKPGFDNTGFSLYNVTDGLIPFHVTNGGNVLIGTTSDNGAKLQVNGNGIFSGNLTVSPSGTASIGAIKIQGASTDYQGLSLYPSASAPNVNARAFQIAPNYIDNNQLNFLVSSSSTTNPTISKGYIDGTTGAYIAVSDLRAKKNIVNCSYGLDKVMSMRPVMYNMIEEKDSDVKHLGFIAQEIKKIVNEAVSSTKSEKELYGLDKSGLIPILVKAIQEQQTQIEELKQLILNK